MQLTVKQSLAVGQLIMKLEKGMLFFFLPIHYPKQILIHFPAWLICYYISKSWDWSVFSRTVLSSGSEEAVLRDRENGGCPIRKAKAGTATFLIELEKRRSIKVGKLVSASPFSLLGSLFRLGFILFFFSLLQVFGKSMFIGLTLTFFAGVCFSLFSPAFNLATNDQWHTLKQGVPKLVVYTAFFYFSVSCFVIALVLNISFLYHPALGVSKSSFKAYLKDWNGRGWALLAGFLCGFGNGLQFMGGQAAGYAAADAVQVWF